MLTISQAAIDFIIKEENSDQAYYEKLCTGFEWPGGASGPTVGIGYDCGYCSRDEIAADWRGRVDDGALNLLQQASGLRGSVAADFVSQCRRRVNIPWAVAVQEFTELEVPKWIARTAAALPNCDKLSPNSLGALVSLAYNRGADFTSQTDHRREMRAIYDLMVVGDFFKIPAQILSMRRLWPQGGDLWKRRTHEAELFATGLAPPPLVASPTLQTA